jgi:hypothetical protein
MRSEKETMISIKYEMMLDGYGDPEHSCAFCGCEVPVHEFSFTNAPGSARKYLCEFCATSLGGSIVWNTPRPDDIFQMLRAETWRSAACVYNGMKHGFYSRS